MAHSENAILKDRIEDGNSVISLYDKRSPEQEDDFKHGFIDVLICAVITVFVFLYCYFFFYTVYSYRPKEFIHDSKSNTSNSNLNSFKNVDTIIEYVPLKNDAYIRRNNSLKLIFMRSI